MSKFCGKCGTTLNDDAQYCNNCGAPTGRKPTGQEQQQPAGQQAPPQAGRQAPPQYGQQAPPQYGQQAPPQYGQQAPPPAGQQAPPQYGQQAPPQYGQQAPPQYGQQAQGQQQYQQAPGPKKSKKPLIGIAAAAAAVLVFFIAIFPMIGSGPAEISGDVDFNIDIEPPGSRGTPFEPTDGGFTTNDQSIAMIEVNQGLSYGFDSEIGEFYLIDNFVAGKETGVFVSMTEPPDPTSEIMMTIEKDGESVVTLFPEPTGDPLLLLFQPKDMSEVNYWEQGVYTFTVTIDDKYATRETNFFQPINVKIYAVPIKTNYNGVVKSCSGEWMNSADMLFAEYPVSRDGFEYILGPELDLSDNVYDITTDDGGFRVWRAIRNLQTPDRDYTLIVGFVPTSIDLESGGSISGYTYGFPANIVCEGSPGMKSIVTHEIAHCYKIGDEYHGGGLNDILNPPPYKMEGRDIITSGPATGTKENVKGGESLGLWECGSLIYDEQRPYWVEQKRLLTGNNLTSLMGWDTGTEASSFWITSDIWNHLFKAFTGQLNGNEPGYATPGGDECWGQCYHCYGYVYNPGWYVQCRSCFDYKACLNNTFKCTCGATVDLNSYKESEWYIECPLCWELLSYEEFNAFNGNEDDDGGTSRVRTTDADAITILDISGYFTANGAFVPDPWYSYPAKKSAVTANKDGEYSAVVYNGKGDIVAKALFDAKNTGEINQDDGGYSIPDTRTPINIIMSLPDDAAKVVINKGDKEVYSRTLTKDAPKVAFTGLTEGQELSNNVTLTWEGSSPDGADLTYEIWYYLSYDELYLVAGDLTGTSCTADLTTYPGSDQGWFKILATDGVRTGISDSPKVSVPFKAPDILNNMPEGTQFKITDMIEIQGKVLDAQDGWMAEEGFEWYVDGRYFESYGAFYFFHYPYMLTPGKHTITMRVTNSGGVSASKDFVIEILEDESDLPSDWPKNDVTLALRMGFYQPLDRLASPITRIELAKMVFSLYATVLPDDRPAGWQVPMADIECEFTDIKNDLNNMDYIYAFMMVAMGLMEPKDAAYETVNGEVVMTGAFDPYGSLTQREAMQIMYMAVELSRSQTYTEYKVLEESEFIPQLTEWGLFDEKFAYNAGEKFSKGMTMIRIARFIKHEFDLEDKDYGVALGYSGVFGDDDEEGSMRGGGSFAGFDGFRDLGYASVAGKN